MAVLKTPSILAEKGICHMREDTITALPAPNGFSADPLTSRAVMAKRSPEKVDLWTAKIIADKPFRLATTAMANKAARSIWAMLTKKQEYRQPAF